MRQTLRNFSLNFEHVHIYCDNSSTICLTKNPIQHSRTKHIDIRHHFLREHVQNGNIVVDFVNTENQVADILTKPLNEDLFCKNRLALGIIRL